MPTLHRSVQLKRYDVVKTNKLCQKWKKKKKNGKRNRIPHKVTATMQSDRIGRDLVKSMNWKQISSKTQLLSTSVTWSKSHPLSFQTKMCIRKIMPTGHVNNFIKVDDNCTRVTWLKLVVSNVIIGAMSCRLTKYWTKVNWVDDKQQKQEE